jgi:hypothetical protein
MYSKMLFETLKVMSKSKPVSLTVLILGVVYFLCYHLLYCVLGIVLLFLLDKSNDQQKNWFGAASIVWVATVVYFFWKELLYIGVGFGICYPNEISKPDNPSSKDYSKTATDTYGDTNHASSSSNFFFSSARASEIRPDKVVGELTTNGPANGSLVYEGDRGGKYYYSVSGRKSYLQPFETYKKI